MWPFKRKTRQRRLEVRKTAPAVSVSLWQRFCQGGGIGSIMLAALFYSAALLMDVYPSDPLPYRVGQYVPHDIHARVAFSIRSEKQLREQLDQILAQTPRIYVLNIELEQEILRELRDLPKRLAAATRPADLEKVEIPATQPSEGLWRRLSRQEEAEMFLSRLEQLREGLRHLPIVRPEATRGLDPVLVRIGQERRSLPPPELISTENTALIKQEVKELTEHFDPAVQEYLRAYLQQKLTRAPPVPLYQESGQARQQLIQEQIDKLRANPPVEQIQAGQRLVQASRRIGPEGPVIGELTQQDLELLRAEHRAYHGHLTEVAPWVPAAQVFGRSGILLLLTLLMCIYVARYRREIASDHIQGLRIVLLLVLMLGLTKLMTDVLQWNPMSSVLTVLMAAIVLSIVYDQRFALAMGTAMSVLAVVQLRGGLGLALALLTGLFACVFLLREVRTRTKLIQVSGVAAAGVCAAVWVAALAQGVPWRFAVIDSLWGAGFVLLAGFLLQGLLPLVEYLFGVATSMTLLEWCDASKPLLKLLAMEAPGTYNHSLQLGTMCEAAADSIGGRGLLARVGAYYHDIGKINKPDYFVENQAGLPSKHTKLSPAMSLLIITAHVKDGLELARQYNLPRVLWEFISTHHGTTLVQYFYHAATEQRKNESERAPDEVEFRYPGPKPHNKEAAILMLADAAESSVRSMSEPTPGRIENQVHAMISRRLMDNQLDACDLTLREVHLIEDSLIKSLASMYHSRIAYPTPAGQKPSAAERAAAEKAAAEKEKTGAGA